MNIHGRYFSWWGSSWCLVPAAFVAILLATHLSRSRHESELQRRTQASTFVPRQRGPLETPISPLSPVLPTMARPVPRAEPGVERGDHAASPQDFEVGLREALRRSKDWTEQDDIDPLLGLDDDDYEPDAARSLGVDGSGNPVEDEFARSGRRIRR